MDTAMTLTAFSGIETFPTHHCISGSIRRIYAFHQAPVSEDMLLGLGSGVGFVYWQMKGTAPFLGGRANTGRPGEEGLETTVGRRTGVKVVVNRTGSPVKAEAALIRMLSAGKPVMLQVDMGFLPYFNFPEEYHFGGHAVVAVGYDPQAGQILVADRDVQMYPVSLADLALARGSKYPPFQPKNAWFEFDFSRYRYPQPEEVRQAIREVTAGMLEPPITNLGVTGIRKASRRMMEWPASMSDEELRAACFNVYIFIDAAGGTGGGLFRYMYGRFLKEAADLTGETRLKEAGDEFLTIGDDWQQVAKLCKQAYSDSEAGQILRQAAQLLPGIASREQAVWEKLRTI